MSTSKNSSSKPKSRPKPKPEDISYEEIEEIIREEVPTVIGNFITDAKFAITGEDKYNRNLILPYSEPTQAAAGAVAGFTVGFLSKKIGKTAFALVGVGGSKFWNSEA